jgi:hypothetical protein
MSLNAEVNTLVIKRIEKLQECLGSKEEFRKCLSLLPSIAFPLRGYIDISTNPNEVFHAYLIIEQLGNVQSAYDGHSEKWYELNKDNIEEFKGHLKKFTQKLMISLKTDDEQLLVASIKEFFFNFHQLVTQTTRDARV